MPNGLFKVDYLTDSVVEWHATDTGDGLERLENSSYKPTIYAIPEDRGEETFESLLAALERHPLTVDTALERLRRGFREGPELVVTIDVADIAGVDELARWLRGRGKPGSITCYNVDFSQEFRYCLETGQTPTPERDLRTVEISAPETALTDDILETISVTVPDEETTVEANGDAEKAIVAVQETLEAIDPDVLVLSNSQLAPKLYATATEYGYADFELGRGPFGGYQTLAGASTFESYGQVGHSPARYNVPGRAIIDRSNMFFYDQSGLEGCLDLARRSSKPLQEIAWASIGNVLTAIQIHEARSRGVLTPWRSWRHEFFKPMRTLHQADRGGFTFAPDVGFHEGVHELDFSSLYPNIIVERNVSPDTICCDCHSDRADVPELGYSVCDERGYLCDVLEPLIRDRDEIKRRIRENDDPDEREALERKSAAIKWILVSCFGYQGFSNAKFGRIECHEAINAYARQILLEAKDALEAGGWRVVHGIVDSLWVQARDDCEQTDLRQLAREITASVGIRLEYEAQFDWVAFVPMRDSEAGALTKYFGAKIDGGYKYRGIECRQRSTPTWIADLQRELIEVLGECRTPEAVCDRLKQELEALREGEVSSGDLEVRMRSSKRLEEYTQSTLSVAALERAKALGLEKHPGQDVRYVVADDSKRGRERVRLPHEAIDRVDYEWYETEAKRAAESVVSPLGWRREEIEAYLSKDEKGTLEAY
ncbi:type B DNA-directed DNA polymerase [Saliphagus sp. WLHSJ1]|uniref:type B DNA-directed DNA polymerase n=1 Tax=Natronosalvus amylolyticus TaxID=2961994 RepID=UPI0020C9F009